jgi:E3 ubiquitin-protein ligase BAH
VHYSNQGQAFKSQAQSKHIEILQSPWLCELMAFHINLRESKVKSVLFEGCNLTCNDDGQPSLTCELFDSIKVNIDLTCSICLVCKFLSAYCVHKTI